MDIEKNDVDLTKLFLWSDEFPIVDRVGDEVTTVFIRLVGDKDLNRARIHGLRSSGELREKLHDKKSDEYIAFISGSNLTDRDKLAAGVKLLLMGELTNVARKNVVAKIPKEPDSDADLEEHEKYQVAIDEFPAKFSELVVEEGDKLLQSEDKRMKKLSDEELRGEYIELTINYVCQEEMNRSFTDMCAFLGTYTNAKMRKKYFRSFDIYENIAPEVKNQLREHYQTLELGMSELKKSQEATQ